MLAAYPSRAGRRAITAAAVTLVALAVSGCATEAAPAVAPDLIQQSDSSNPERPAFFVQWKSGMPGLTQRPAIDKETKLPEYPASAARARQAGTTTLEACLTVEGKLVDVHLLKSSGSDTLDNATLEWAKTAKYQPAAFNGEPFAICGYKFDYEWRVEDERTAR